MNYRARMGGLDRWSTFSLARKKRNCTSHYIMMSLLTPLTYGSHFLSLLESEYVHFISEQPILRISRNDFQIRSENRRLDTRFEGSQRAVTLGEFCRVNHHVST